MPARSQAQQRFMGMVHAEKEGKLDKSKLDPEFAAKIERIAASIKAKAAREYAETKHKDLPKKVKKKGITKKASAYLKMLRMALKAAPKTTKTVAPAAKAVAPKVDDVVFTTVNFGCCTLFVVQTGALGVNETVLNGQSTVSVSVYFKSAVANAD